LERHQHLAAVNEVPVATPALREFSVRTAAITALLLVTACGGGGEPSVARPDTSVPNLDPTPVVVSVAEPQRTARVLKLPERIEPGETFAAAFQAVNAPKWTTATSEDPTLTVEDRFGRRNGTFHLSPVIGRGYEELKLTVLARRLGEATPPAPVQPSCREDARCQFILSKPYTLTLSDARDLKLVARNDSVILVAKTLKLDAPANVEIVLADGDKVLARTRVGLLTEFWSGKPM
jgi:hypothetical protein